MVPNHIGARMGPAAQLWQRQSQAFYKEYMVLMPFGRQTSGRTGKRTKKNFSIDAASSSEAQSEEDSVSILGQGIPKRNLKVGSTAIATIALSVTNRVLYKMALVPLQDYPFFLAQFLTFGYVIVYSTILFIRYRAGIVTKEMLDLPKLPFVALGALEALGLATGMAAAANLPGASIPILTQVSF